MSLQAALFRAVNVGGNSKLPMADLRALAQSIGLKDVQSLLQSGNLVFDAGARSPAASAKLLEAACAKSFGLKTDIYVRTPAELGAIARANPFADEARNDPAHLVVLFLRRAPEAKAFKTLQAAIKGREIVRAGAHDAYVTFPDGIGTSKLTLGAVEKHLSTSGTMRNWNTFMKLVALTVR